MNTMDRSGSGGRERRHHACLLARVLAVGLLAAFTLPFSGCCTLIGLGVGAAADNAKAWEPIPPQGWSDLRPGTKVEVVRKDADLVRGVYEGTSGAVASGPVIMVRTESGAAYIPVAEIRTINSKPDGNGAAVGALVGLGLDCVAAALIVQAMSEMTLMTGSSY